MKNTALALLLVLSLPATSPGCATVAAALPTILAVVQEAELAVNMIATLADVFYRTHPNAAQQKTVEDAVARTRTALAAVLAATDGAGELDQGKLALAFDDFKKAYDDLLDATAGLGVHVGAGLRAAPGGGLTVPPARDLVSRGLRK